MIETMTILPGITLRCFPDHRFKQGCLSLQLVRPMSRQEAALNALLIHPLVGDWEKALNCFNEMKEAHKDYLPQFFKN